jgi:hypothetical protein
VAGPLRRLLDARASSQDDQVGQRDLLAAGNRFHSGNQITNVRRNVVEGEGARTCVVDR